MAEQRSLFPRGLAREQLEQLAEFAERAATCAPGELLRRAENHVAQAQAAYASNRLINARLAAALGESIRAALDRWDELQPDARRWLAGAMLYFVSCDDDEPDFQSPIGFEDDAEVLNACLRFAQLDELCVRPEDYDDA